MKPNVILKAAIVAHAKAEYPRECCGVIINAHGHARYVPCRNRAVEGDQFAIDEADWIAARARGEVVTVVHSHPTMSPTPSPADLVECERSGKPWYIVNPLTGDDHYFLPSGYKQPLLGREWVHAVFDCYSLIRDWYREERAIALPDFERDHMWWLKPLGEPGSNLYRDNFYKVGFREVSISEMQPGDSVLMQIAGCDRENHGAVVLEGGLIIHHAINRLSCRDVYGGYWRECTTACLRYVGTPA